MKCSVFIFGEAEKGPFATPIKAESLVQLFEKLGEPPTDSYGLDYAIQTLLFDWRPVYCRVHEEGFSIDDYHTGARHLKSHSLSAVCLPGVGDKSILDPITQHCQKTKTPLLISERDLHDYLWTL